MRTLLLIVDLNKVKKISETYQYIKFSWNCFFNPLYPFYLHYIYCFDNTCIPFSYFTKKIRKDRWNNKVRKSEKKLKKERKVKGVDYERRKEFEIVEGGSSWIIFASGALNTFQNSSPSPTTYALKCIHPPRVRGGGHPHPSVISLLISVPQSPGWFRGWFCRFRYSFHTIPQRNSDYYDLNFFLHLRLHVKF